MDLCGLVHGEEFTDMMGMRLKLTRTFQVTSLTFPYVENLYWDSSDMLWVTSYGGGLYRFDPRTETFKHYAHDPEDSTTIGHPRVLCAVEDVNGRLWFGTENGLNRFDPETETFTRYNATSGDPGSLLTYDIRNLYIDSEGTLWIATGFIWDNANIGALSKYIPETDSFENFNVYDPVIEDGTKYSPIRGLYEDSKGNFWVGNAKGLYKMDRETNSFEKMIYDPERPFAPGAVDRTNPIVFSILEDQKGGLWVGTIFDYDYKSHLLRYDSETQSSQILPVESAAWQVYESQDGTIWVAGAGDTGKVLRIKPKPKTYDLSFGSSVLQNLFSAVLSKVNEAFIVDHALDPVNGTLWGELAIVFNEDSIMIALANYNPESGESDFHLLKDLDFDESLSPNNFGSKGIVIDKNGRIWGSVPLPDVGLYQYDPKNKEIRQFLHDPEDSTSISSNEITSLMMDSRGEIWATTMFNGLNRINPETGEIKQYHFNEGRWSNSDRILTIFEGNDRKIWVAGELILADGTFVIVTIDPTSDEIETINIPTEIIFGVITMMAQSPVTGKVIFVLGNNSGIGVYDPAKENFSMYSYEDGKLPFTDVAAIAASSNGDLWVASSGQGSIVQINQEMEFFAYQDVSRVGVVWRSGFAGNDGNVYFLDNANRGWKKIDPSIMTPEVSKNPIDIRMTELLVMGEKQEVRTSDILENPLWLTESIRLPNDAHSFELSFSDFDYRGTLPQIYYRLFPYEEEWKSVGNEPEANYYRIPTGEYTFQVKTQSGPLANQMTELNVVMLPPWWMTWWAYSLYGLIFICGVFVVDRVQRRRLLQKAHTEAREKELAQAREIEKAYNELKTTQTQLIQSEKMASLGELTAGIAHEIQNPLNFVNNFSDVNSELVEELKEEIDKGNIDEAKSIADDIGDNEKKIVHHGKRAEEIVRSMLQHSRGSEGKKEPTDISALADEYLRLAYHGMRAKDKSFNVTMDTKLDPGLGEIEVVPQDIGRVILNLITNAFFAVNERKASGDNGYQPTISVSTRKSKGKIEIDVKDNGSGIREDIKKKIFQPFFSTKGTGKGTGLGLSLSYDIITKGHGGSIEVESKEGEGTEFKIFLPEK
jgi:signal transduction histidine kinase/ligand-binding sensor domain-containing protein